MTRMSVDHDYTMDSSSTNYSTTPLIPNRNAAHPSLAPVNIDALRQSLLGPEQQATQEVVTQLEGQIFSLASPRCLRLT